MGAALPFIAEAAEIGGTSLSVLGAINSSAGAKDEAAAQAESARYSAQVAENNAQIQQENSSLAGAAGNAAVQQQQLKTRADVGAILANQGASGINVNSGSGVDVRTSAAETGQLSAINIRSDAARQAYGYQTEAQNDQSQAQLDKASGTSDITAGNINSTSTLLGGIGQAGTGFAGYLAKGGLDSSGNAASGTGVAGDDG